MLGRKRKFSTITESGQDRFSREELKRQGIKVAPYVSYESFKKAWNREHKGHKTPDAVIRSFWGDYITSGSKSLKDYFEKIRS